jgi:hypothetical protein
METPLYIAAALLGLAFRYQTRITAACRHIAAQLGGDGDSVFYLQNAITPPAAANVTLLTVAAAIGLLSYSGYAFGWATLGGVLAVFYVAGLIGGLTIIPKEDAPHFVKLVYGSMVNRHADFVKNGDTVRAAAIKDLTERVEGILGPMLLKTSAPDTEEATAASAPPASPLSSEESLQKLINDYGALLEKYDGAVAVDARVLPGSKLEIKTALMLAWKILPGLRDHLEAAYMFLATFQDGVGAKHVTSTVAPGTAPADTVKLLESGAYWRPKVTAEMDQLLREWKAFRAEIDGLSKQAAQ